VRAIACACARAGSGIASRWTTGISNSIDTAEQALALDAALDALEQTDARAARVVELRYFAGLSLEQAAETLGLARRTIDRDWRFARAFIKARMA